MNPMDMMKMAGLWRQFQARHPKFPQFLSEAAKPGVISEDAVLHDKRMNE